MADELTYLKIDGVEMPVPSEYIFGEADFDNKDSGRTETGLMVRTRVRQGALAPEFKWKALTTKDLNKLLKAVKPVWVNVTIFSPRADSTNFIETFKAYAKVTRKATLVLPNSNPLLSLWAFDCTFTEQ